MLQVYNDKHVRKGLLKGFTNLCVERTLSTGDLRISFQYPRDGIMASSLKEECYIRTKTEEYVLKEIHSGDAWNSYTATLNIEDLEGKQFPNGFESIEKTVTECLTRATDGTGWVIGTCEVTKRRTIRKETNCSAWDVLQDCVKTYRCEVKLDSLRKEIHIFVSMGADKGCYFIEDLNLRKIGIKSDTYDFYTRIIPRGKDGLKLWVGGKEYLDNHQYSEKIKTCTWRDERYTNTTSLTEDAAAKLAEMSKPYCSYTADVCDLAALNPVYRQVLDYDLGDTVWLISKKSKVREKQRIVKIKQYPQSPEKNSVELSNTNKSFAEVQKEEQDLLKAEAILVSNSNTEQILEENYMTSETVETTIAAATEYIELEAKKTYQTIDGMDGYSTLEAMAAAIKLTADAIQLEVNEKVGNDEFGTKISQNAHFVQLAWNSISEIIQFIDATMRFYDSASESKKLLMELNQWGMHFYHNALKVGGIGTNHMYGDESSRGLSFALEDTADFITWAKHKQGAEYSGMRLTYYGNSKMEPEGLHLGCHLYLNNFQFFTGEGTSIRSAGNGEIWMQANILSVRALDNRSVFIATRSYTEFYSTNAVYFNSNIDLQQYRILNMSDVRMKTNIADTQVDALAVINAIDLKSFDWIQMQKHEKIGVIAQQVEEIEPELIDINAEDGHYSLNQLKFIDYLLGAVQQLSQQIDNLQRQVNNLSGISPVRARTVSVATGWTDPYTQEEKQKFAKNILDERLKRQEMTIVEPKEKIIVDKRP